MQNLIFIDDCSQDVFPSSWVLPLHESTEWNTPRKGQLGHSTDREQNSASTQRNQRLQSPWNRKHCRYIAFYRYTFGFKKKAYHKNLAVLFLWNTFAAKTRCNVCNMLPYLLAQKIPTKMLNTPEQVLWFPIKYIK